MGAARNSGTRYYPTIDDSVLTSTPESSVVKGLMSFLCRLINPTQKGSCAELEHQRWIL